ncbi:MAG TPA: hypothetical protein VM166_11055 [Gemmatimonadaceae bacterium]|nr:hypothetical protein [Gemmatimonadaceae bacterium]
MRRTYTSLLPVLALLTVACTSKAQNEAAPKTADTTKAQPEGEAVRAVAGGGISVAGWSGMVDPGEASRGGTIDQTKFAKDGNALHVTTGPASAFWDPTKTASGDYTVKASFTEPKYMNLIDHPHPYGLFIGGSDMGTPNESYLYCAAYGNGTFIVRGFGPAPFKVNGKGADANAAIHKAAGKDSPVSQDIALSVKGDKVSCSINGTVVGTYNKADVVGPGKLKSTDGVYGIRFAHNTEGLVNGLTVSKP